MKKIIIISFLLLQWVYASGSVDKDEKEISKIEICAIEYGPIFHMPLLIDDLLEMGLKITTTYRDINRSEIDANICELEKRISTKVDSLQIEGNTRAVVTFTYNNNTQEVLYILGTRGDIIWKNRQYKFYYPLVESVYYFYPERYLNKEDNFDYFQCLEENNQDEE